MLLHLLEVVWINSLSLELSSDYSLV